MVTSLTFKDNMTSLSRNHSIPDRLFPIGSRLELSLYL